MKKIILYSYTLWIISTIVFQSYCNTIFAAVISLLMISILFGLIIIESSAYRVVGRGTIYEILGNYRGQTKSKKNKGHQNNNQEEDSSENDKLKFHEYLKQIKDKNKLLTPKK